MPLYVLDTDHMTAYFRGGTAGSHLATRLQTIAPDDYGTTIISFEEQLRGWLDTLASTKKNETKIYAYQQLNSLRLMYQKFAVWQYTEAADAIYSEWVKNGVRISSQDLRIAAIALTNGAVVLTANRRHFGKIPGLIIEDWTRE